MDAATTSVIIGLAVTTVRGMVNAAKRGWPGLDRRIVLGAALGLAVLYTLTTAIQMGYLLPALQQAATIVNVATLVFLTATGLTDSQKVGDAERAKAVAVHDRSG